jgi:hypothetical protein
VESMLPYALKFQKFLAESMQEVESMLPCVEMVLQQTRRKPMFGQDLNTHLRIHKVTKQCCQNASYFSKVKVLSRVGKVSTLNSSYCILLYLIRVDVV